MESIVKYIEKYHKCHRSRQNRNNVLSLWMFARVVSLFLISALSGCTTINLQFAELKEPLYNKYNNDIKFAIGNINNELGQSDPYKLNRYISLDRSVADVVREALINGLYEEGYDVGESNVDISMDILQISHTYTGQGLFTKMNFVVKDSGVRIYEKEVEHRNQHRPIGDKDGYYNDIKYAIRAFIKDKEFEKVAFTQIKSGSHADYAQVPNSKVRTVTSDIDKLPLAKSKMNKNAYAIVIGIEQYRQKLPKADFAVHDAQMVSEYLTKVLGYPEEHVVTLTNDHATYVDIVKYVEKWLLNHVEQSSSVFFYYSGHGAPNPNTGDAYLVPYDGDPSFIDQTGYSLNRMYDTLGKLTAKQVIVVLDSCFSGAGGRSVLAEGARPLVMNMQKFTMRSKNMTILTAASGDQISSTYRDKGHGLFTYFMLKGIKDIDVTRQDGSININALYSYLKPQVESVARRQYNNEQVPQLIEPNSN